MDKKKRGPKPRPKEDLITIVRVPVMTKNVTKVGGHKAAALIAKAAVEKEAQAVEA